MLFFFWINFIGGIDRIFAGHFEDLYPFFLYLII